MRVYWTDEGGVWRIEHYSLDNIARGRDRVRELRLAGFKDAYSLMGELTGRDGVVAPADWGSARQKAARLILELLPWTQVHVSSSGYVEWASLLDAVETLPRRDMTLILAAAELWQTSLLAGDERAGVTDLLGLDAEAFEVVVAALRMARGTADSLEWTREDRETTHGEAGSYARCRGPTRPDFGGVTRSGAGLDATD